MAKTSTTPFQPPQKTAKGVSPEDDGKPDPFSNLPEAEKVILHRQIDVSTAQAGYFTLFRYASPFDFFLLGIALLCSIGAGIAFPLMTIVFGQLAGAFQDRLLDRQSPSDFSKRLSRLSLYFVYLGIANFFLVYISTVAFSYMSEKVTQKIREKFLRSSLHQNIGFFDHLGNGEITTRITSDMDAIQDGIGRKVGLTLTATVTFFAGYVIAFIKSWKLTLILSGLVFGVMIVLGIGSTFLVKYEAKAVEGYAVGGTVAEETLSAIRNTHAFNTQHKISDLYEVFLKEAKKWGLKSKFTLALVVAFTMGAFFLLSALCFWQGSRMLVKNEVSLSTIVTVLESVMVGSFSVGNVAPHMEAFTKAVAAAAKIFATIDRPSPVDSASAEGDRIDGLQGTIELRNVKHIYPSRPEVLVLDNVSLLCPAGKVTALVGPSGAGKSTIIDLLERFHEPVGGQVLLDGRDTQTLNIKWLRQNLSLVSQEPVLFRDTIFNNIAQGLTGTVHEHVTYEEKYELVVRAATMANADSFINSSPQKYDSQIGERGLLLSGGQKQRIAIARAIVSDPKILLLDEATSALDSKSEVAVQAALDAASKGRTTIVIAHRLSTIKGADNIVVMQKGKIVEQGTHQELLEQKAIYHDLVEIQQISNMDSVQTDKNIEVGHEAITSAQDKEMAIIGGDLNLVKSLSGKYEPPVEPKHKYSALQTAKLIASFNNTEKLIMLLGLAGAIIAGGGFPVEAVFFGKSIESLSLPPNETQEIRRRANFWAAMYLMLAGVEFLAYVCLGCAFAYCAELLIYRVRDRAFRSMLRQDVSWFDRDENSASSTTAFLSTKASQMSTLSGPILGSVLAFLTTLIAAVIVASAIGWKLGLVCLSTLPVLLTCGTLDFHTRVLFERRATKMYASAAAGACEALGGIRTVASLTREEHIWDRYHEGLDHLGGESLRSSLAVSVLFALSQSLIFPCLGLVFWYGGTLIKSGEYGVFQFFLCLSAVVFGFQSAAGIFILVPNLSKAKQAAEDLQALFDRKPTIDPWSTAGAPLNTFSGAIAFRNVSFRYPMRPAKIVLKDINLSISSGQYVALVGSSGCGKSTIIQLIERFYDPVSGTISADGQDISTLNVSQYRSFIALVAQEPTLYQGTIRENILLGSDKPDSDFSDEVIEQACRDANIHDFIASLPEGLNTTIGAKGTLLSGGQKQRIAIARALIRNPRLLLLDEATAALDTESERTVQMALDKAAKGRTTVAVAHRLSTIRKADLICVIDEGRVVETGTHEQLLEKRGKYFELVTLQNLR
ncbi:MAG: GTPase-activating protein [Vezdaea aestivalis]|nr:MAG: GTPase-activating protein [Vezdaea aestivalis]